MVVFLVLLIDRRSGTRAYAASGHAAVSGVITPTGSGIAEVARVGSSRGRPDTNHSRG
jgi:hypothetical protein